MVKESGNNNDGGLNQQSGTGSEYELKKLVRYYYVAISALIIGVILLMADLKLFAGILIIVSACAEILVLRKTISLFNNVSASLDDAASSSEKKDDVITEFSHKIREPLNNLVIITDMLME